MKKILKLLLVLTIISSCSTENNSKKTISVIEEKLSVDKVLNDYMLAWSKHDKKKIESFYDNNVIWYDLPSDYTTKGKSEVGKAITDAFLNNVKDMYWVKSGDTFISGKTITYEWIYGGIYSGKWGELDIKNKKFSIKGISTTSINENGKFISQKDYYDFYGYQKQLGVLK